MEHFLVRLVGRVAVFAREAPALHYPHIEIQNLQSYQFHSKKMVIDLVVSEPAK